MSILLLIEFEYFEVRDTERYGPRIIICVCWITLCYLANPYKLHQLMKSWTLFRELRRSVTVLLGTFFFFWQFTFFNNNLVFTFFDRAVKLTTFYITTFWLLPQKKKRTKKKHSLLAVSCYFENNIKNSSIFLSFSCKVYYALYVSFNQFSQEEFIDYSFSSDGR